MLRRSCDEKGQTIVIVTHDPFAASKADRVVFLQDGVLVRELGFFRAVGATRRQLRTVVTGEAALLAGLGAAIGIAAGLGIAIILPTVYGGSSWGITDLDHWAAATDAVNHALVNAIVGWVMAVFIGVIAGILIAQGMLRHRRLMDELQAEGH
jgi:energy-coupling factor transporter ATP-binding protein EcfA2